jgi:hypothetical protein
MMHAKVFVEISGSGEPRTWKVESNSLPSLASLEVFLHQAALEIIRSEKEAKS